MRLKKASIICNQGVYTAIITIGNKARAGKGPTPADALDDLIWDIGRYEIDDDQLDWYIVTVDWATNRLLSEAISI